MMENIEKYWKNSFNKSAVEHKEDHKVAQWSKHGLKRRIKFFQEIFYETKPESKYNLILDAGCGSGIYSSLLRRGGYRVISADYSLNMIKVTKEKLKKEFVSIGCKCSSYQF